MYDRNRTLVIAGLLLVAVLMLSACVQQAAVPAAPTVAPAPEAKPTEAAAPAAPTVAPAPEAKPTEAAVPAAGQMQCPIVIGAAVHMTGGTAIYDMPPLEGARLAVKEINDAGGINGCEVKMIELDGKSDPAKVGDAAVVAVQQGAQVLIAPCDFDYGSPVAIVAQENGLVGISECASSPLYSS